MRHLPKDVVDWQNKMVGSYGDEGKLYSGTYLRTINNQLSAIFNHAVKYGLGKESPAAPTIKIGERQGSEMKFWTKEQYLAFSEEVMDKPASFYAFEILYWCGLRGRRGSPRPRTETTSTLESASSTSPRATSGSGGGRHHLAQDAQIEERCGHAGVPCGRLADFLDPSEERRAYRIFCFTKSYLHHEMKRGCAACGLEPIRIHDLPPQPCLAPHRDGVQRDRHSGPALGHETYR